MLVFLHADSTLPKGYDEVIERELNDKSANRGTGAFAFKMSEEEGEGFGERSQASDRVRNERGVDCSGCRTVIRRWSCGGERSIV